MHSDPATTGKAQLASGEVYDVHLIADSLRDLPERQILRTVFPFFYEIEVIQNLLGNKGATLTSVKEVISHPQALGQCAEFIREKGYKTTDAVNTAVAAKLVADSGRTDIAAIGSVEAGKKFGLEKIEGHINESGTNTTRFAVFTRAEKTVTPTDKHFVMLFTVKNAAGSLGEAITVIGKHGFNLKALKSRPTKELIWDYYFYAEGEGNIMSDEGKAMLEDLKSCCNNLKILGHFEKETFCGRGTLFYPDGMTWYEGEFKNDKPHGKGKLYYPNGCLRYDGEWRDGQMNGKGSLFKPINFKYANSAIRSYVWSQRNDDKHLSFAKDFSRYSDFLCV